ncbi:MAG: chemotaxis protein CheX [bacterium]|nr:chemotaxis protein CheX [bacterium]
MKQIFQSLRQVIFEIFGDMFFMFPEDYDQDVDFPQDWIKYRIKVTDGSDIFLDFYFTPNQAKQMTENFLGEEAGELDDVLVHETLKEAVNVMGGNLLNRIKEDYHLGIPEECTTEKVALLREKYDAGDAILLNIEEEPFLALVTP